MSPQKPQTSSNADAARLLHELQVHQAELIQQNEELRRARTEIEAGLARYTDLYEFAPVAYYTLRMDGTIIAANLTGSQLLDVPRSLLRGQRFQSFVSSGTINALDDMLMALGAGSPTASCELDLVTFDGTALIGQCQGSLDPATETCRVAVADVTAQRRAEAALRVADRRLGESQRLEALGRLAGGVAHDFNNILQAINGTAEILEASLEPDDPRREDARTIRESGDHAAALVRQLLAFGRRQTLRPTAVLLEEVLQPIMPMLHRTLGEHIALVLEIAADLGPVSVDPVQFEQVIVNLALNARDAMRDGGTLTISIAPTEASAQVIREHPNVRAGSFARVSVTDTGTGIRPEVLPHLFEPFFTTKDMGHGTGLGLASVEGIVAQSGGWVTVTSELGRGSTFNAFFPSASRTRAANAPGLTAPLSAIGGTETVLYVEDDTTVRLIGARMLRLLGYTVIDVGRPELARDLDADALSGVRLLVTDVIMPGMNGTRLAAAIETRQPGLPVLFVSGFAPDAMLLVRLRKPRSTFLAKPFTSSEFGMAVRHAIDAVSIV